MWWKHVKVLWKKFKASKIGAKLTGCCGRSNKIQPEMIDPTTGLPYGFDPKYFPDGMPPEAMEKYEASLRPKPEAP